jgi:hypothetical protein
MRVYLAWGLQLGDSSNTIVLLWLETINILRNTIIVITGLKSCEKNLYVIYQKSQKIPLNTP